MKLPAFYSRHRKKILGIILILFVGIGLNWIFGGEAEPEYVTAQVTSGDVVQTVEAVGEVISDTDLDLQFSTPGIVAQVFVKEGERVRAGQRLAQLKGGSRSALVASQAAALQSAQASLNALIEGSRPEEIAIAEAEVENRRAQLIVAQTSLTTAEAARRESEQKLALLKSEADINLAGDISTGISTAGVQLIIGETALTVVDDVLNNLAVQDAILKDRPAEYQGIRQTRNNAQTAINDVRAKSTTVTTSAGAAQALELARGALYMVNSALDRMFQALTAAPETPYFNQTERETQKAKISAQRQNVQSAISAISSGISALRNASASYDTRLATEESNLTTAKGAEERARADILTFEASLRMQEAQLALTRAGSRKTDIDAAAARVRQARADLARTSADFAETILTAPIDGTVTKVNLRLGEYTPAGAAITVLGNVPYRIEMFVSEIDLPRLQVSQSGSINLDAFPDTDYKVRVSEINQTPTDVEGIPKYKVMLDFVYPHEEFRVGMTGDVTVFTGERRNVIKIPGRAVVKNGTGVEVVRLLDGEDVREQPVNTGMEGESGDIEVTSGLKEGDTVILLERE